MARGNQGSSENSSVSEKTLKLCTINICGLSDRSKFTLNKFNSDRNIDILALQETGTTEAAKLQLENMKFIHDANNAKNRGAALYVNNKFSIKKLDSISSPYMDACWGLVHIYNKRLIVGSVYVKLNVKPAISEVLKMIKAAQQKQTQLKAAGIILTGDFNARHIAWGDSTCNEYGKELFNSLDTTKYSICSSQSPTFLSANGSSNIDLTIISNNLIDSVSSCTTDTEVELFSGAPTRGHVPVLTDINIRGNFAPKESKETLDISKMNWEKWKSGIERNIQTEEVFFESEEDPHSIWNKLNSIFKENTDLHGSTKKCCVHSKPYWTESLSTLSKSLRMARKNYIKRNTDSKLQLLNEAREAFDAERQKACQEFIMNKAKNLNAAQSFQFWKEFSKVFKKKSVQKIDPLDDINGGLMTDHEKIDKEMFSVFFEAKHLETENFDDAFYREVNNIYDDIIEQENDADVAPGDEYGAASLNREITLEEIIEVIKKTPSSGKSVDNFNFHPQMFSHLGDKAINLLKKLFNLCLSKHKWVWEVAMVIFLKKEGKPSYSKPGAYRPISITSYIGKLLERIIVRRIEKYLIANNLVDPDQEGFSTGKNTIRYLNRLHLGIQADKEANLTVICLFVDFEKAFDSAWKRGLMSKLYNLGIKGNILKLINSFLISRKVTLNINGVLGNIRECSEYGLPQGSVISPLLFKIFVSDFLSELNHRPDITLYKFADDGTVKLSAPDSQTCVQNLEITLSYLTAWTKKWRMKINCDRNKTEIVCFNTAEGNKELVPNSFKLGDNVIYKVAETKVLGLTIDEDLTYKKHSQEVLKSLHAKWAILCKYSNRHWGFNQHVMIYLIKALFISKLSYGSHIWISKDNIKEINKLWYHILKSITGAVLNVNQNVAEVILGMPPILIQTKVNSIKHFLKLNNKPIIRDRYKEFLATTYSDVTKSPRTIHIKFKDIFKFLDWKMKLFPNHFNISDKDIVNRKLYSNFHNLSQKSCSYSKDLINQYIETVLWRSALMNQFQLDGYPTAPNPSCDTIPIPRNTSRETEIVLLSLLYKNNLLNSSLYKLSMVPSPLCSVCGQQEETAEHILFRCSAVEEELRNSAITSYRLANKLSEGEVLPDSYIGLLDASRDGVFICSCIDILKRLNLRVTVDLEFVI